MLKVRHLIVEAYRRIGFIADGEQLEGAQTNTGVSLLNEIISALNVERFLPFTQEQAVVPVGGRSSIPCVSESSDPTVFPYRPVGVVSVAFQLGGYWYNAQQVSPQSLVSRSEPVVGVPPSFFAYKPSYPQAEIVLSNAYHGDAMISFVEELPHGEINDTLPIPPEYASLLIYGLAAQLGARYGMDAQTVGEMGSMFSYHKETIKRNNSVSEPITRDLDNGCFNNIKCSGRIGF